MKTNIKAVLAQLGIEDINQAYSTGNNWGKTASEKTIESQSPVDGLKIAAVKVASANDYDVVIETAQKHF
jgi:aldehyde dehydrogenase (NAD+)